MRVGRVCARVMAWSSIASALFACSDDRETAIDVVVTEAPGSALGDDVTRLRLGVFAIRPGGDEEVASREVVPTIEAGGRVRAWTERVRPAREDDPGRVLYRFVVEAERDGNVIVDARARLTFVPSAIVTLPLRLDASCTSGSTCATDTTCRGGACVDDFVPACELIETRSERCRDDPRDEDGGAGEIDAAPVIDATMVDGAGDGGGGDVDMGRDGGPSCVAVRDCRMLGRECGESLDDCGAPLSCGECSGRMETCGALEPNRCAIATSPDVTPPTCAPSSAETACVANEGTFTVTCTDDRAVTAYECRAAWSPTPLPAFAPCTMPWTLPPMPDGAATVEVRAIDDAGNRSVTLTTVVEIDGAGPVIDVISPDIVTNGASLGLTVELRDQGCSGEALLVGCTFDRVAGRCDAPITTMDGEHHIEIEAHDGLGNVSLLDYAWTLDRAPPVITIPDLGDRGGTDYDALVDLPFTWACTDALSGCEASSAACVVGGDTAEVTCGVGAGSVRVGVGAMRPFGNQRLVVTMRDRAGNEASAERELHASRCARELQLPLRESNGFWRGPCCAGLVEAEWLDVSGIRAPRGDGSCRPASDADFQMFESTYPLFDDGGAAVGSGCAPGLQAPDGWGVRCETATAARMCLGSMADALSLCGDDPPTCATPPCATPIHGHAGEGWHAGREVACAAGSFGSPAGLQRRANNYDVCFWEVDLGADGWSVSSSDGCKAGLYRHCRDGASDDAQCVCTSSPMHPYASDGHG